MKKFSNSYLFMMAFPLISTTPAHSMQQLQSGMASGLASIEQTTQEFMADHPRVAQAWQTVEDGVNSLKRCLFQGGCSKKKIAAIISGIIVGLYILGRIAEPRKGLVGQIGTGMAAPFRMTVVKPTQYIGEKFKGAGGIIKRGAARALMPYKAGDKVMYEGNLYTVTLAQPDSPIIVIHPVIESKGTRQPVPIQDPGLQRVK